MEALGAPSPELGPGSRGWPTRKASLFACMELHAYCVESSLIEVKGSRKQPYTHTRQSYQVRVMWTQ